VQSSLFRVGRRSNKFSEPQYRKIAARLAVNLIHTRPGKMALFSRRFLGRKKQFHFDAVGKAVKRNLARGVGNMQHETMPACRKNGGLQLEDDFVRQARAIGKETSDSSHRGGQPLIGVQAQANVQGARWHG